MTLHPRHKAGIAVALLLFVADQVSKWIMLVPLALPARINIELLPVLNLHFVQNRGVSMGLFHADNEVMRWILVGMTAIIATFVGVWMFREKARADVMALGLVLGGALGNILDRIRFGYVVDFIDLHFGAWRPFLVFNVADAAISIGVLILLARALLLRDKAGKVEKRTHA